MKGKWIEIDHERLRKLLADMEEGEGYISLMDALRMQMGAEKKQLDVGSLFTNGKWLSTLLLNLRRPENIRKLAVPASLIGNWQREAEKFVPSMRFTILHGKGARILGDELKEDQEFLTITTYGMTTRVKELGDIAWECIILDEAQAIKNTAAKQTEEIKKYPDVCAL